MSDWKKIIADAEALKTNLHKQAFLPMPPDQSGASAPPPEQAMQQQQAGAPMPGQPMPPAQPMPPQAGGAPGAPGMPPQQVTMDPMMRLDQLEQMVGEQQQIIQELMGVVGEEIGPALEKVMEKMTTHDNAILEVSTLASGSSNKIDQMIQELSTAMGGGGAPQPTQ